MTDYEHIYTTIYKKGYHAGYKNLQIKEKYPQLLTDAYHFKSILDIGCSQGRAVLEYQKLGKNAYGIDVSKEAIRQSLEQNIFHCLHASVLDIPFKNNFIDAVVTCDVLEHLAEEDLSKAIKELVRITKEWFFIKVAYKVEMSDKWLKVLRKATGQYNDLPNLHLSVFPKEKWIELFKKEGVKFKEEYHDILIFKKG